MTWLRLLGNTIRCSILSLLTWISGPILHAGTYVYDWKHYPNYVIYVDDDIEIYSQLYVEDVQLDVKYYINERGAVLGYIGDDGYIDLTSYIGHVTHEGTVIVWGPDDDPDGMWMVIWPFNTQITNLLVDDSMDNAFNVKVIPVEGSQMFGSSNIRWQNTDRPNHWFFDRPRVTIDAKYNRDTDYPYTDTTYWNQTVSRYDDKKYDPTFVVHGTEIDNFNSIKPPVVSFNEFRQQVDRAAWVITLLKRKYDNEPSALDPYRRSTYMP